MCKEVGEKLDRLKHTIHTRGWKDEMCAEKILRGTYKQLILVYRGHIENVQNLQALIRLWKHSKTGKFKQIMLNTCAR